MVARPTYAHIQTLTEWNRKKGRRRALFRPAFFLTSAKQPKQSGKDGESIKRERILWSWRFFNYRWGLLTQTNSPPTHPTHMHTYTAYTYKTIHPGTVLQGFSLLGMNFHCNNFFPPSSSSSWKHNNIDTVLMLTFFHCFFCFFFIFVRKSYECAKCDELKRMNEKREKM